PRLIRTRQRPPPRSTLFPYTTLFRSRKKSFLADVMAPLLGFTFCLALWVSLPKQPMRVGAVWLVGGLVIVAVKTRGFRTRTVMIDRKSTRLNSSHVSTSYAVFCLKKK